MRPYITMPLVAAAFVIASVPSFGQQQEIVVEAPRVQVARALSYAGDTPVDVITVSHIVSYSNIDISTSSGAQVLKQRIADAAKAACAEIEKAYPNRRPIPSDPPCERGAIDAAMVHANAAIAAAEKARTK